LTLFLGTRKVYSWRILFCGALALEAATEAAALETLILTGLGAVDAPATASSGGPVGL